MPNPLLTDPYNRYYQNRLYELPSGFLPILLYGDGMWHPEDTQPPAEESVRPWAYNTATGEVWAIKYQCGPKQDDWICGWSRMFPTGQIYEHANLPVNGVLPYGNYGYQENGNNNGGIAAPTVGVYRNVGAAQIGNPLKFWNPRWLQFGLPDPSTPAGWQVWMLSLYDADYGFYIPGDWLVKMRNMIYTGGGDFASRFLDAGGGVALLIGAGLATIVGADQIIRTAVSKINSEIMASGASSVPLTRPQPLPILPPDSGAPILNVQSSTSIVSTLPVDPVSTIPLAPSDMPGASVVTTPTVPLVTDTNIYGALTAPGSGVIANPPAVVQTQSKSSGAGVLAIVVALAFLF